MGLVRGGAAVALLVAALASCSGDDGDADGVRYGPVVEQEDPLAAETCEPFHEFAEVEFAQRLAPEPQDHRAIVAALRAVEFPTSTSAADVEGWEDWIEAQEELLVGATPRVIEVPRLYAELYSQCVVHGEPLEPGVSTEDPDVPPFPAPSDAGAVAVVEQGVSGFMSGPDNPMASFGFVVENTTDLVLARPEMAVTLVDGAGAPVGSVGAEPLVYTLPVLEPGERFGIGDTVNVDRPGVAGVEVTMVPASEWTWAHAWPEDHELVEFPDIALDPPNTVRRADGVTVEVTYDSGYGVLVPSRDAFALLRNEAGDIVGGMTERFDVRPGRGFGEIWSPYDVTGVDDARSEVFL